MVKSAYVIQMEFGQAQAQAERLEEIARDIGRIADNSFESVLSGIGSAWQSDSSAGYIRKGRKVQDELRNSAQELIKSASAIRKIAETIYDAEMRALSIAQIRQTGGGGGGMGGR